MIVLNINRQSNTPLFMQVVLQLKRLIDGGVLLPGEKMPSTRIMADKHGLNRSTVYKAYEELWALGYIQSRPGSYSYIRKRKKIATPTPQQENGLIQWDRVTNAPSQKALETFEKMKDQLAPVSGDDIIDMAKLYPDKRLYPVEDYKRCMDTVLSEKSDEIFVYGDPLGYRPLRDVIARRLQLHGISVTPDEILITSGAQNGIDLLLKILTRPGSRVALEEPTYIAILPLLKYYQAQIVSIPMDHQGMKLDLLETAFKKQKIDFLYTMPNFQNPTGISTSQEHREKLLSLCEKYRVPLVEDAFEEEMKYYGKVALPIKSMDKHRLVIYLGTFSKILFPGIRIGWIAAARECIERLAVVKKFSDLSSNLPSQAAMHEFCVRGYYELHLKRLHRLYRKRMQTTIQALNAHLRMEGVSWTKPNGGYLLWLTIQNTTQTVEELNQLLRENGIALSPGTFYFDEARRQGINTPCFRISIAAVNEDEILAGIKRMAGVFKTILRKK